MGNETRVTHVAVGGAFAAIIAGVMKFYQPALMNAIPGAEAALAVILTAAIAYIKKPT